MREDGERWHLTGQRALIAARTAIALCGLLSIGCAFMWSQLLGTHASAEKILTSSSKAVVACNKGIQLLREDPGAAGEVATALDAVHVGLGETRTALGQLKVTGTPIASTLQRQCRDALVTYLAGVDRIESQLVTMTALVQARTQTIQKLGAGFGQLSKLSDGNVSVSNLRGILKNVETVVDTSLNELRSISASASTVVSSEGLVARLSAMSAVIGDLINALDRRDQRRLNMAIESFAELMQGDWKSLFMQRDASGLSQVASSIRDLSRDQTRASAADEKVVAAQKSAGILALLFGLAAGASAIWAWKLKRTIQPRG